MTSRAPAVCPFREYAASRPKSHWTPQGIYDPIISRQQTPSLRETLANTLELIRGKLWPLIARAQTEQMPPHQYRHLAYAHTLPAHIAISTHRNTNDQLLRLPRYGEGISGTRGWDNFPVMAGNQNLIMAKGEQRRSLEHVLLPFFQSDKLKGSHFETIKHLTQESVRQICQQRDVALKASMMQHSCRVISATYLGADPECHDKVLKAIQTLMKIHFELAQARPMALMCKILRQIAGRLFKKWDPDGYFQAHQALDEAIKQSLAKQTLPPFLQGIREQLLPQEVIDNLKMLYFAGTETTSSLLATTAFLLAKDGKLQEVLRQELRQANIGSLDSVQFEDLAISSPALPGLKCLVLEALRLVPPIPGQVRAFTTDMTLNDIHFRAGTSVVIDHFAHNHDERNYGLPEQFQPERFFAQDRIDEEMKMDVLRAFGSGKTRCPGQHIALLEVQLFVIELLLKSHFSSTDTGLPIEKGSSAHVSSHVHIQIQ